MTNELIIVTYLLLALFSTLFILVARGSYGE